MLLHQCGEREAGERRDQRVALTEHVGALDDRVDDAGPGRRATDAAGFQFFDQGGVVQARGGLGLVPLGHETVNPDAVADGDRREHALLVGQLGFGVIRAFDIGASKS